MKNRITFESDELFDTTSDESGEEYISETSEDTDTDKSIILACMNHKNRISDDEMRRCIAETLNANRPKQAHDKQTGAGQSRSSTRSTTVVRQKRRRLASIPQTSHCYSSNESGRDTSDVFGNSTAELVQNLPDSSTDAVNCTAKSSLIVHAVPKKENGSRMYTKKQYCLFCKLGVGKMPRHLERAHKDQPEVAQVMSLSKGSKERRMHLEQ